MKPHALVLDTSNNNPITAALLKQSGACALIAKDSEGTGFVDGTYAAQRKAAAEAHIPFGAYLFLHPFSKGSEAKLFVASAKLKPHDIMPIIDVEVTDGGSYRDVAKRVHSCAGALAHEGLPAMVYSGSYFWNSVLAAAPELHLERLPMWEADYPGKFTRWFPGLARMRIKVGHGVSVKMWQWTDHYTVGTRYYDASRVFVPINDLLIKNNLHRL